MVCGIWMLLWWVLLGYVSHRGDALALARTAKLNVSYPLEFALWLLHSCVVHEAITLIFIKCCVEDEKHFKFSDPLKE